MENVEQKEQFKKDIIQKLNERRQRIFDAITVHIKSRTKQIIDQQEQLSEEQVRVKLRSEKAKSTMKCLDNHFSMLGSFKSKVKMGDLKRNSLFTDYLAYYVITEQLLVFENEYMEVVEQLEIAPFIKAEFEKRAKNKEIQDEISSLFPQSYSQETISMWLDERIIEMFVIHDFRQFDLVSNRNLSHYTKDDYETTEQFLYSMRSKNKTVSDSLYLSVENKIRKYLFTHNTLINTAQKEAELRKTYNLSAKKIIKRHVRFTKSDVRQCIEDYFQTHRTKQFNVFIDELFAKYPEAEKQYKQTRLARLFH